MNPLRLASLDASPFCFAKRGGEIPRCARNDTSTTSIPLAPLRERRGRLDFFAMVWVGGKLEFFEKWAVALCFGG